LFRLRVRLALQQQLHPPLPWPPPQLPRLLLLLVPLLLQMPLMQLIPHTINFESGLLQYMQHYSKDYLAVAMRRWSYQRPPTVDDLWALPRIVITGVREEYNTFRKALRDCFIKAGDIDYIPVESTLFAIHTWSSARQVWVLLALLPCSMQEALSRTETVSRDSDAGER
jgi:hypothetical protein